MGLFRTKNSSPEVQKATSNVIYPSTFGDTTVGPAPVVRTNTKAVTEGEITYLGNAVDGLILQSGMAVNDTPSKMSTDAGGDIIDWWDIAQSHFFTVQIFGKNSLGRSTGIHLLNGDPIMFSSGEGTYTNYIPIKSMNFNYTSYDNMNIPMGIFGDLPLLHRKKVTSITFSCYDTDQDIIEKALNYWEHQCFPGGNYVSYLADVVARLTYTSYDVCGNMNFQRILEVIPASSVSVSRSYEENAAKMLNFSVVAVGAAYSNGAGGEHNKVYYEGEVYGRINEWENREQGRLAGGRFGSKYNGIEDGYGNGLIQGYASYNVVNRSGGVEYGPGQIRASISRDEG